MLDDARHDKVQRAALAQASNEAWWVLGGLFLLALLLLPAMRRNQSYALTSST